MTKQILAVAAFTMVAYAAQAQQMCAMVVTKMYNAETDTYKYASNSCVAAKLAEQGYVRVDDSGPMDDSIELDTDADVDTKSLLSVITEGAYDVKVQVPKCPPNAKCITMPKSSLVVRLPLKGCLDKAHVTYKVSKDADSSQIKVSISALNIADPMSKAAFCIAQPVEIVEINLGHVYVEKNDVTVQFLKNVAN